MEFQIINKRGTGKKKIRLKKELNKFLARLQMLIIQSHCLVSELRSMSEKMEIEKIKKKLKKS